MNRGRLNWTVDPHDVFDATQSLVPGFKAFRRSDNNALFGVFPETYTIIQNREMFELIEPMMDAGMIEFETAGAIFEGRDVWSLFKFNAQDEAVRDFFGRENITPFLLIHNNHDRTRLLSIQETMIRVVCKNTLSAATGAFAGRRRKAGRYPGAVLLRHTKNVRSLSVEAVNELWGRMTERYEKVVASYETLKARYISQEEFETNVLDILAPLPNDIEADDKRVQNAVERALGRRELVTSLYRGEGAGIDGDPTAWNAYNAAVEAVDHFRDLFKVRVDDLEALFPGGTLANKKQDVLNALTDLSLSV
jgi:phage/plasmid-like protein (TIGR03299 family)